MCIHCTGLVQTCSKADLVDGKRTSHNILDAAAEKEGQAVCLQEGRANVEVETDLGNLLTDQLTGSSFEVFA